MEKKKWKKHRKEKKKKDKFVSGFPGGSVRQGPPRLKEEKLISLEQRKKEPN